VKYVRHFLKIVYDEQDASTNENKRLLLMVIMTYELGRIQLEI